MADSFLAQTILRRPTVIKTVENERVVVRDLPAPGPQGPSGIVTIIVDGGSPSSDYSAPPVIDGGAP